MKRRFFLPLLLGLTLLMACQAAPLPTIVPTAVLPATATPTFPMATATSLPTFTPTDVPPTAVPATVTATPTATPRLQLTLALPPTLADTVSPLITDFAPVWDLQLLLHDDPEAALAAGQAQLALAASSADTFIYQEPIALVVPFTTPWEAVSAEEAQAILANGDERVTIMPWSDIMPNQKALRVDGRHPSDADYPLQQTWSLLGADEYDTAVSELAAHLTTHWPTEPVVHLVAVGDVMLDRSLGFYLQRDDLAYPFVGVAAQLQNADITVGNVESSLGDTGQPAAKSYTFRAPPQAAPSLALAGFDVVSLANNHGMDYGPDTLLQGIQLLHDAGLSTVGAGANLTEARTAVIRELNGLRLAFLGYVNVPVEGRGFNTETWTATDSAPGLAWAIPEWISADVTAVRSQADIVIIILHSGYEYREDPSPPQIAAAQAAITAGADLVLGHHAHILQGLEFADNSSVIVYGLGNFAFEIDGPPETMLLNVWLDAQGVRELEIVPAVIRFGGQPRLADPVEANAIRQTVYRLTDKLNQ